MQESEANVVHESKNSSDLFWEHCLTIEILDQPTNVTSAVHQDDVSIDAHAFIDYNEEWIVDSGCSHHATEYETLLSDVHPYCQEKSKGPNIVAELESRLYQLQEELKKTINQLNTSESHKKQAQQEAEEAKKQLSDISPKLVEFQQQVLELSTSEEDRVQELHKLSQDRAWESELEAVQKQHAMDVAALASAMNEVQKLKVQLNMVSESDQTRSNLAESAQEMDYLRTQLSETLSLVEKRKK